MNKQITFSRWIRPMSVCIRTKIHLTTYVLTQVFEENLNYLNNSIISTPKIN